MNGGWYDIPGGRPVSVDFTETIMPGRKWFRCSVCGTDLRSGQHHKDWCDISPDNREQEVDRVRFIIQQMFKNKGLRCIDGRKLDE